MTNVKQLLAEAHQLRQEIKQSRAKEYARTLQECEQRLAELTEPERVARLAKERGVSREEVIDELIEEAYEPVRQLEEGRRAAEQRILEAGRRREEQREDALAAKLARDAENEERSA